MNFAPVIMEINLFFIAADDEESETPPDQTDPIATGVDLAPWIFSDFSNYQNSGVTNERMIDFNIYNIGNQNASPTADWAFYYIYFNAYNANDYGVLFYDNFNTTIPSIHIIVLPITIVFLITLLLQEIVLQIPFLEIKVNPEPTICLK